MTDEIAANQATERGLRAQRLLEDDMLKEAFASMEADFIAQWRVTPVRDTDARERWWQAVNIVGLVRDYLGRAIVNGRVAQRDLDELAGKHGTFKT
jgi:hypothetical protein